jgi:hypothetical protein
MRALLVENLRGGRLKYNPNARGATNRARRGEKSA